MKRSTRIMGMLAAAVVAVGASAVIGYQLQRGDTAEAISTVANIDIGGPIDLVAQDGQRFTKAKLAGKPYAIFFGFTRCPNVCPTTLSDLTLDLADLGPLADKMNVVFVSIDPDRDTPASMKDYISAFDPRIIGLSGTPAEIAAVAKAYRVFYEKVPTSKDDYTMNHTASVYLMDAKGGFVGTVSFEEDRETQVAKLKRLVSG